ncbi:MAG: hypothetical protein AAF840_10605 [Bacteroidota bacterium]
MHRYLLYGLAALFICSILGCPEDCDFVETETIPLEVSLENPASSYAIGETIWLSTEFAASQPFRGGTFTIGEGGGLIVTQIFNYDETVTELTAGLPNFTPLEDTGDLIERQPGDDPAASLTRFTCIDGNCAYRTGFRAEETGTYLLRVVGSTIDETNEKFRLCNEATFGQTTLTGAGDITATISQASLNYDGPNASFGLFNNIFPQRDQNLFLIRVE